MDAVLPIPILTRAEFLQRIKLRGSCIILTALSLSLYMLHVVVRHTLGNWLAVQCSAALRPLGARVLQLAPW